MVLNSFLSADCCCHIFGFLLPTKLQSQDKPYTCSHEFLKGKTAISTRIVTCNCLSKISAYCFSILSDIAGLGGIDSHLLALPEPFGVGQEFLSESYLEPYKHNEPHQYHYTQD